MKALIQIFLIVLFTNLYAQELKIIETKIGQELDFGEEVQKDWEKREILMKDLESGKKEWDNMSKEDRGLFQKYGETFESMWDVLGGGCSWYCGAGNYSVKTSSELTPSNNYNYKSKNLSDFSYQTSWIEGVEGYGIGETIEFGFAPTHPRMTEVIIVNGYVRTHTAWKNNSRVKKLKMYVNNKPIAIINLQDVYAEQSFKLDKPLGYSDRDDFDKLKQKENWIVKFEILEVYKGDKYDDTGITEIYFDGLDVHCLAKGTEITMSDFSVKKVEDVQIGDFILSYNIENGKFEKSKVLELANPYHANLIEISFSNGTKLSCTEDHPFLNANKDWTSLNPFKTEKDYKIDNVLELKVGTELIAEKGVLKIIDIVKINSEQETFTIVKLQKNKTFIANGIVTGIEELRVPIE